jgi:hypothetical protein
MITLTDQTIWMDDYKKAKWALGNINEIGEINKMITFTMITISGHNILM